MAGRALRLAVVGLGRAGRARVRAAESLATVELAAVVTREGGEGACSLAEVLSDPSIDAIVACTPNLLHAATVRSSLEARKHVLVEYPLAPDPCTASGLLALARERACVLHVEHIELLSPTQATQRRRARELGRLLSGTLRFRASGEGWIMDPALAGSAALRALARLHRLVDLFGDARVDRADLVEEQAGYRLRAELSFARGGVATLVEERAPGLARSLEWDLLCERGRLDDPPAEAPGPLFLRDLECFVARVRDGAPPYVSEARIVHVLGLVAAIEEQSAGA